LAPVSKIRWLWLCGFSSRSSFYPLVSKSVFVSVLQASVLYFNMLKMHLPSPVFITFMQLLPFSVLAFSLEMSFLLFEDHYIVFLFGFSLPITSFPSLLFTVYLNNASVASILFFIFFSFIFSDKISLCYSWSQTVLLPHILSAGATGVHHHTQLGFSVSVSHG
jgi:hypothetical protein